MKSLVDRMDKKEVYEMQKTQTNLMKSSQNIKLTESIVNMEAADEQPKIRKNVE